MLKKMIFCRLKRNSNKKNVLFYLMKSISVGALFKKRREQMRKKDKTYEFHEITHEKLFITVLEHHLKIDHIFIYSGDDEDSCPSRCSIEIPKKWLPNLNRVIDRTIAEDEEFPF